MHLTTSVATGGGQIMLRRLVEQGAPAGYRHGVVSLLPAGGALHERLRAAGAEVADLGVVPGRVPSPAAALRLARLVRRFRPEVIQGWMYHGNLAASTARRLTRRRCPVLWGVHHALADLSREKPSTRRLLRVSARLSRGTAAIVYCSRASARQHEELGYDPGRTIVIPNGFDCEAFRPRPEARAALRGALGVDEAAVVIGMAARYHPMKDHAGLLAAAARLGGAPPIHLVLVGAGVDAGNPELMAAIRAAGLLDRVSLLGERHDMPELMAGFDLLALSSWTEAFPLVLGEAMACGVPCVATDVGDSGLIIGDTGKVVAPGDPGALAAGLRELIALGPAGRARLGAAARARVVGEFAVEAVAQRYHEVYARALEQARR